MNCIQTVLSSADFAEVIDQALALANDSDQIADPYLRLSAVAGWLQGARQRLLGSTIAIQDLPSAIRVMPAEQNGEKL